MPWRWPGIGLAGVTGLDVGVVSTQLDRLFKEGIAEKTSLSSSNRTAFQVAERFFNIWYLMRHSSRRQRLRLRWLTEILRRLYTARELRERATGLLAGAEGQGLSSPAYRLALSDALEDRDLRTALRSSARWHPAFAGEGDVPPEDDLYLEDVAPEPVPAAEAAATYRRAIERKPGDPGLWYGLARLLQDEPDSRAEAEAACRKAIEIDPKYAQPWNGLGILLAGELGRHAEAEAAFRKAIEIEPKEARQWNNLGIVLARPLGRPAEAEAAYRKAIEIDPKYARPWGNLGNLLAGPLARHGDAEAAYRRAIEIDPKYARPWNSLGNLLADHLFRFEEAEQAYRTAQKLEPQHPDPLYNLASLLLRRDGSGPEAETIYQKAIAAVPPHGAGLLRAFHALAADNFGTAIAELGSVLEEGHPELFIVFRIELLRVLQFAAERGNGDKLLAWFKSSGFSDRYWPLYVAFDAYLHGEDRLMDVNPEVRSGARRLLAEMTRRPSEPPPLKPGKGPRSKSRSGKTG